jgi:hypothetical protein
MIAMKFEIDGVTPHRKLHGPFSRGTKSKSYSYDD